MENRRENKKKKCNRNGRTGIDDFFPFPSILTGKKEVRTLID